MNTGIWTGIAILALVAVLVIWNWWRKKNTQRPLTSLVLLLSKPRDLSADDVREVISTALAIEFDPDNTEATEFVLEMPRPAALVGENGRSFMITIPQGIFMMHCASIPYEHSNEDSVVQTIQDGRLQRVFREHRGWLSCDVMQLIPKGQPDTAQYSTIGQIIAHFAGDDTLGIFCPALRQCNEYSSELRPALLSGNPLTIFDESTTVPVIAMKDDDLELLAAAKEARDRWSEFIAAFTGRKPGDNQYSVKAPFSENGITEWIWVSPTEISDTTVTGTLGNDPNELQGIKYGDQVTVPIDQISDWIYFANGDMIGGFSIKVLQKAMEERG